MSPEALSSSEIFIVDDDPGVREVLSTIFSRAGFQVTCFAEGASLLAAVRASVPTCIILDVHIPGRSGLEILQEFNAQEYPAPIFVISGRGDIPMAVEAIKNGAFDFIEKPIRGNAVVKRVREAIEALTRRHSGDNGSEVQLPRLPGREPLTFREREVLAQIMKGASSKEAGHELGISPRTIDVHRANIMDKLGAKNAADLVRIVMSEGRNS